MAKQKEATKAKKPREKKVKEAAMAQQHTQQEAAAETEADGKPQTKKRANRKGN